MKEVKDTILTSYCFLAALTESQNDLYKGVYIPIIKRTISFYSLNSHTHGHDTDIQALINELYGITVPLIVVRQLLKAVETEMSRKEKSNSGFRTHENGKSFSVQKYSFLELEEYYKQGGRNAQSIQLAFENFLTEQGESIADVPSFSSFLSKNKTKLSSFFKSQVITNGESIEKSFINHVNFLETIERNHHQLFKIAESIYLGSIVASLFECEFDFGAKASSDEIYYLDTQIVLKALDIQGEADTTPIVELLNLIKESGGKLKVLDVTIGEIGYNINQAINNYNTGHPTTSINEACIRKGKNKAWLITLNGSLENYLKKELNIDVDIISNALKDKYQKSNDINELKGNRKKQANAEHDVFAYLYVRDKRGGSIKAHQKAKIWFVTANKNLLMFNIQKVGQGNVPEITLPNTLTTLLWLRNPQKLISKVKSIGLNELIASTIHDEIATKELINEFDSNLKSLESISKEEYQILLESMAHQSAKSIERLNNLAYEGKTEEFNAEAHKIVDKERKRRAATQDSIRKTKDEQKQAIDENQELKAILEKIESELKLSNKAGHETKSELERLASEVSKTNKYIRRLVLWFILFILSGLLMYFTFNNLIVWDTLKIMLTTILGLSGLWSFGSFVINLLKSIGLVK